MTAIDVLNRVHLDVERDLAAGELVNLVQNPSGDLGGWGWITPVASTKMSGGSELAYVGVASTANWFTTELSPVTAGNYVAASWTNPFHTNSGLARARLVWYDATGAVVSSGTQGAYQTSAGSYAIAATVVPAGVTQVALRFDLYSTTGGANPTSTTLSLWLTDVTMATATTANALLQIRTNLVVNPSFEVDASNWTASLATLARTTSQFSVGTASGQVTSAPTVVTNLCPNPSFETNTTGWSNGSGTVSVARISGGYVGSFSLQADTSTVTLHSGATSYVNGPLVTSGITPGQTYYFTYAMKHTPPGGVIIDGNARALLRWYNSSGTQIGSDIVNADAGLSAGVWLARSFSAVAPAGAARVQLFPGLNWTFTSSFGSTTSTDTLFQVDQVAILTANTGYFDGASTDTGTYQYDWTGTAHASTSTRTTVVSNACVKTPSITVAAGTTYAASAAFRAASTTCATVITFEWKNSSGTLLSTTTINPGNDSSSAWTRYGGTAVAPAGSASVVVGFGFAVGGFTSGVVHYVDAALVEASNTVGTYFDGSTTLSGYTTAWTGTANASTSTATSTNNLVDLPTAYYVTITGESASIGIDRPELNLATLTATIVSSTLDPANTTLLRPNRRIRVLVDVVGDGSDWEPIFTGKTQKAEVEYHLLEVDDDRRAVITLTAVDPLTRLAQESRPDGVGTIAELPYVLEGCGVPWNVNGSGNQVSSATVVATNDQASAVDQIAVTRDTRSGYAWVDRKGIIQVWDAASISTTVVDTLDETAYTGDIGISYATDRIINSVSVDSYEVNPATGETAVANYGPFRASGLKPQDQIYDKTVTVQGLSSAAITTLATAILASNATPVRRIDYVNLPLTAETIDRALLDNYDLVTVINSRAGLSDSLRIVHVTHTIQATQKGATWLMRLDFNTDDSIAAPQIIAPPSVGSGADTPGYHSLTHAGTSGTVQYAVVNGLAFVRYEVAFTSTTPPSTFTLVTAANGLPAAIRPSQVIRGRGTNGTVICRIDVNTDGSIVVAPLTAATNGVTGYTIFPAGL